MPLNDAKVKAAKPRDAAYKLTDGNQLFLHVTPAGGKFWRMNYTFGRNAAGKPQQKTLTFGRYPVVSLGEARDARDAAKKLLLGGRDPGVEKRLAADARAETVEQTFEAVARRWYATNQPRWSAHHAADVIRSLERDVFAAIGALPIAELRAPRVLKVLSEIQDRGSIETAHRIQQRMSAVFVYGIAAGVCEDDPAGTVKGALAPIVRRGRRPSIVDRVGAWRDQIDAARRVLVDVEAADAEVITKLAHRLLALTAVRPGELRNGEWAELEDVDLTGRRFGPFQPLWRIPAARMKGDLERKDEIGGDHLVPLSPEAVDVLVALHRVTGRYRLMFPNHWSVHKPISENAIGYLLKRIGYQDRHCPHGWRAAFSTIMNGRAKRSSNASDSAVIELMLAHVPKDKVKAAYDRAAFMDRRRELAQEWASMVVAGLPSAEGLITAVRRA